ncbi:MAG: tRNA (adenosine(37)-N6)-dimethylallyltransferase MiaA, partial [Bdellovibrionaceae bacterium]|nr:tRNA (adenosine(37)-N6)-dimethylallyltransferase MiaA [Pseudobdellovibrionaceae bacterium]
MNVIIICGPTATGKSQLAIKLAQSTKGHIINADSIQFYQGLKIGSAAPSDHDLAQVPHHLFHVLAYPETATVGWFYRTVMNKLYELQAQEVPFVFIVGGSGFYLQTLEKGLLPVTPHNHEVRLQLEREKTTKGLGSLYEELCARDPQWAKRINPNDAYRIVRALEILRQHNKSLTQIQKEYETQSHPFPFPLLKLGLKADKNWLLNRVEQRVHQMIQNGLLEEVEGFILRQQQDWPALKAVGYKEC